MIPEGVSTAAVPGYAVNDSLELNEALRAHGGWRGKWCGRERDPRE